MRWLIVVSWLAVLSLGCGGRSTMDSCAQGSVECPCYPSSRCNRGLVCKAGTCTLPGDFQSDTGGTFGSGGSGTGGTPASATKDWVGGNSGSVPSTGGAPPWGFGGMPNTGGVPPWGFGGMPNTGGVPPWPAVGGSTSGVGGTTTAVTFNQGRATGAMNGYGWVAMGSADTVKSPSCAGRPITPTEPCVTGPDWPRSGLCVDGYIPALPSAATASDYNTNWGILFAAETSEPSGGGLGVAYRTATFNLSGSPSNGLRAVVHRKGDPEGTNYCTIITSGVPALFTSFNTACWDGTGVFLTAFDVPALDWVGVQVSSMTFSPVPVSNLCLTSIFFN